MRECLRKAITVTNEWIYSPTAEGDIRSRLKQRVIKEMSVPVELRSLEQVVNPQPRALAVIRKLLDWISRFYLASQQGLSRPAFKTVDGEAIFPPQEERWWLTELQQRNKPENMVGNEDGPLSEAEEEEEEKDDTDDEDPTTDDDVAEQGVDQKDATFKPTPAWLKGLASGPARTRGGMEANV